MRTLSQRGLDGCMITHERKFHRSAHVAGIEPETERAETQAGTMGILADIGIPGRTGNAARHRFHDAQHRPDRKVTLSILPTLQNGRTAGTSHPRIRQHARGGSVKRGCARNRLWQLTAYLARFSGSRHRRAKRLGPRNTRG